MAGKVINYYAGGNTARGFYSFFESNISRLEQLFILKGGPGTGKSTLMKKLGEQWNEQGYDVEYIHCASDNGSIDGVIFPQLKVGIVDGTAPHVIEPKFPGIVEEYVNLGAAWDADVLKEKKDQIIECTLENREAYHSAYATFKEALDIHDEWEKLYIENMDYEKADQVTDEIVERFFFNSLGKKTATVIDRYLGAATPKGAVDFIQNLTEDLTTRIFIKGRPGSGKSTMLKKLAAKAEETGHNVEIYHCGFDPNSLDMIIVRELGMAIFDSTSPHEYFPERDGDEIIDMYERAIKPGTDELYADEIKEISTRYSAKMKDAIAFLAQAKKIHDDLEAYYVDAMDFSRVDQLAEPIYQQIKKAAAQCKALK